MQHRQPANDEEAPLTGSKKKSFIEADESVYAAILFLPAISRLKTNGKRESNREARLAFLLVFLNAVLQMGVVRVVQTYDFENRAGQAQKLLPQNMIGDPDEDDFKKYEKKFAGDSRKSQENLHKSFLPPHEKAELEAVYDLLPLCRYNSNGTAFTCMPNSVKFVYLWNDLDNDGDGVWTIKEAQADVHDLKRKWHVSPETIFNNIINGLRLARKMSEEHSHSNKTFYLTESIESEQAIPKAYFQYWQGDAMMCSLFDPNSCEAAAKDGVFENALKPGRSSPRAKGIYDLDSAIQYCYHMLTPGGGCETLLPTDFRRNREQRWDRCGSRTLVEGGKYTNPFDPDQRVHVLKASYASVDAYARATSRLFKFFLSLIIMLWLLSLLDEWKEIIKFGEFLWMFPSMNRGELGGEIIGSESEDKDQEFKITSLSTRHRCVLILVYIIRVTVCSALTSFGTKFLLVETSYLDLVMNSLALTFILTIDAMLFSLTESEVKNAMGQCRRMEYDTLLPTKGCLGYCLKKECWGLFLVPVVSIGIVLYYNYSVKEPVMTALGCACLQEGNDCMESMRYKEDWWMEYWSRTLPAAMHQIEALRIRDQGM